MRCTCSTLHVWGRINRWGSQDEEIPGYIIIQERYLGSGYYLTDIFTRWSATTVVRGAGRTTSTLKWGFSYYIAYIAKSAALDLKLLGITVLGTM